MSTQPDQDRLDRRALLLGAGGMGAAIILGARLTTGRRGTVLAQATPGTGTPIPAQATPGTGTPAAAGWTPPSIPQPLPTVGGVAPTVVGAAPPVPAAPDASPAAAEATPLAEGAEGQEQVESPGGPAQPLATPGTPVAGTPVPAVTVTLTPDFRFDPVEVTIRVGQAVRWVNAGRSPQTVTGDPARAKDRTHVALPAGAQPWDSGVLNASGEYVHVFDIPGTYVYFSIPQEQAGMVGRVVVQG